MFKLELLNILDHLYGNYLYKGNAIICNGNVLFNYETIILILSEVGINNRISP